MHAQVNWVERHLLTSEPILDSGRFGASFLVGAPLLHVLAPNSGFFSLPNSQQFTEPSHQGQGVLIRYARPLQPGRRARAATMNWSARDWWLGMM
jgi:hypothetical protein